MSKGLEALEKVEDFFIDYGSFDETGEYKNYISLYQTPEYQVIRKELKRLEELEKAFDSLSKEDEKAKKLLSKEIEKNRALEIIKKNELLSVYQDNGRYFVIFTGKYGFEHTTNVEIPKEEYNLLKEVLL